MCIHESRNVSAFIIAEQLKDYLVHELWGFISRSSASSKMELRSIKHKEVVGELPKDMIADSVLDSIEPLIDGRFVGPD